LKYLLSAIGNSLNLRKNSSNCFFQNSKRYSHPESHIAFEPFFHILPLYFWPLSLLPWVSGGEMRAGKEMLGALWTKTNGSITLRNLPNGGRIDVENLKPWERPWNLHYQAKGDSTKYVYNNLTNNFRVDSYNGINASKTIQNLLKSSNVRSGIAQWLKILWISAKSK
jgi:hypothetical protein